jgi:hypothetical protein
VTPPSASSPGVRIRAIPALALYLLLGYNTTSPHPTADRSLDLLFIGNSLTSTNDLPAMVEALATSAGSERCRCEAVTFGNYALRDHWAQGDALAAIHRGGWDLVVLQQGPSSLPGSRLNLIEYTRRFAGPIREIGARPALYMVWPTPDRATYWDDVTNSYTDAADAVEGMLFPAGEAFREALRRRPQLELFSGDGYHPSAAGTYLAALVIYATATHRPARGLSAGLSSLPVSAADVPALEQAADAANATYGRD